MPEGHKVLIIGEHPIRESIVRQFASCNSEIRCAKDLDECLLHEVWHDIVILFPETGEHGIESDAVALKSLGILYESLNDAATIRPKVHLLLHSQESLRILNTREYNDEWHRRFELSAFTIDDMWAKNVVCPDSSSPFLKGLDYLPVTLESEHTVHLVILGISNLAVALAENAALVAHYPNYNRNHALRTRITVIDENIGEWRKTFVSRHKSLMDNSYIRDIDVTERQSELHRPMYEGKREDFVDVEWEFVRGTLHDVVVQDKLYGWASDGNQLLSVAVCHENDEENLLEVNVLADMLQEYAVPIYLKQGSSALSGIMSLSPRMKHVTMIGMRDSGYDVTLPLLQMAKRIKYVYDYCYTNNIESDTDGCITAPSFIDDKEADNHWLTEKKAIKRYSNICNAMTLRSKMRSLGHTGDDRNVFYAISRDEIELIGRVEHNRWSMEEMLLGFRPCNDEETADVESNITRKAEYKKRLVHYDLRAYDDLREDETGKNVNTYDLCISASIPLIAYQKEGETE